MALQKEPCGAGQPGTDDRYRQGKPAELYLDQKSRKKENRSLFCVGRLIPNRKLMLPREGPNRNAANRKGRQLRNSSGNSPQVTQELGADAEGRRAAVSRSGRRRSLEGSGNGVSCWRLLKGTQRSLCLLVFILLFPETVTGMEVVVQPPFVARNRGGSVNLTCHLQGEEGKILRTNVYWYFTTNNKNELIYLTSEGWHKDRLTLTRSGHLTDKSIQLSGLGFNDTRMYFCKVSVIDKDTLNSSTVTGNGTQLLVHGPMSIGKVDNDTSLMCQVEAGMVQDIEIVWKEGDNHIPAETMTVVQTDLTAYLLTRRLKVNLSTANHVNARTFTCLLQHSTDGYITHYAMEVPERFSPKHDFEEPILLYVLLFMNRLLILIMVLVIFKVK